MGQNSHLMIPKAAFTQTVNCYLFYGGKTESTANDVAQELFGMSSEGGRKQLFWISGSI